jgi:aminoglycoside phosphotransferase (APT) family kinase protein
MRAFLLSGLVLELAGPDAGPSILERAAFEAGGTVVEGTFKPGSDQAAVAKVRRADGSEAYLRIAPSGSASDPAQAAQALRRLEALDIPFVPRVVSQGAVGDASWAAESIVPGKRARRMTPDLMAQVVDLCARLPSDDGPPTAVREELEVLVRYSPDCSDDVAELLKRIDGVMADTRGVMKHGDLWLGNVLTARGRLAGVIDWDGWHPSAVPGSDLVELYMSLDPRRRRQGMDDAWREKPWRSSSFSDVTAPYWRAVGVDPDERAVDMAALAWWCGRVGEALSRHERLARDRDWLVRNVGAVLENVQAHTRSLS